MKGDLPYLHRKTAKGREYLYFDTGMKNAKGKRILTRLPGKRDPRFGDAYASARASRTKRSNAAGSGYLSLDDLIRKYELSPEFRSKSDSTKRSYTRYLGVANRLIRGPKGESPPAAGILPKHVVAVRDELADTPGAANQVIRALGSLYAWASKPEHDYAPSNPASKISLFTQGEHQPWPEDLLEEALEDPQVQVAVALLYFTGQRIGDVVRMRPGDVQNGEIYVFAQKTKSKLWIPMSRDLTKHVARIPKTQMALLTNEAGRPWTRSGLSQRLQKWAKDRGHHVVPHGLRKNAVNELLEAGCTVAQVSAITDHSLAMVEHYAKGRNQRRIGRAAIALLDDARTKRERENLAKTASENG